MLPVLQVGPLAVPVPAISLLVGIWLGLALAERYAGRLGADPSRIYNLALVGLVAGLIGGRLVYAARYLEAFAANPASLVSLNPGLLDPWGGAAVGLLAALVYGQRKGMLLKPTLDALTPALAVFMAALGISHLASGAAYGAPTGLPWGIELWGAVRHPSQVYEILAALAVLGVIWPGGKRLGGLAPGARFLIFVGCSAAARLFLEAFRGDSSLLWAGVRTAQVVAWLALAASLLLLGRLQGNAAQAGSVEEN